MSETPVRTEQRGKVLLITLDRPKANAINVAVSRALHAAFDRLQRDEGLLVGVLASANERIFSAGWDLKEVATNYKPGEHFDAEKGHGPGGFAGITENFELNKPVIAAIRGAAVGGGFEMAMACDILLASPDAWFQLPEMQRGFLPDAGGVCSACRA
jgi:crotonobetainyl-CoA hydratase